MAGKKIVKFVKVQIEAGKAVPAPPLGPALGQAGIPIGDFINKFNTATKGKSGILSVKIYVYEDKSYDFVIKTPLTSSLLKTAAKIQAGSKKNKVSKVATLSKEEIKKIAEEKMVDLTARSLQEAIKTIEGSAKSMGIEVK